MSVITVYFYLTFSYLHISVITAPEQEGRKGGVWDGGERIVLCAVFRALTINQWGMPLRSLGLIQPPPRPHPLQITSSSNHHYCLSRILRLLMCRGLKDTLRSCRFQFDQPFRPFDGETLLTVGRCFMHACTYSRVYIHIRCTPV